MYPEWKKRHAQKASDEKMEKFQQSKPLWAAHDKQVLAKRSNEPPPAPKEIQASVAPVCAPKTAAAKSSLLSNVCCEDPETLTTSTSATPSQPIQAVLPAATMSFVPPPLPALSFSLGILTVSDRAASGDYPTGDLSGPAVKEVVESILQSYPGTTVDRIETEIVPDEADAIQSLLLRWSGKTPVATDPSSLDLILTTGGTGFSPRDVTPEATTAILERPCEGLLTFCQAAMQGVQPLAALSRGTAGLVGTTLVANLPGNPQAVKELVPVLLPLALQAVADVKGASVS
jgi:molybdenum cofactor synthesis domain-containing protein